LSHETACLHLAAHRPDALSGGTGENAQCEAPSRLAGSASALFAGDRVHYPGALPEHFVNWRFIWLLGSGAALAGFGILELADAAPGHPLISLPGRCA
jgi:hypothetical protein